MERWELIERIVLLTVGAMLLLLAGWLMFFRNAPENVAWLALLAPCTFWVFWQALYEDKLDSQSSPTPGERVMFLWWICARGLVLGGISLLLAVAAWNAWRDSQLGMAAFCVFLAFLAGWIAAFGGGRLKSMSDDRLVHRRRMNRYK